MKVKTGKVSLQGAGVGGVVVLASGGVDSGVLVVRARQAGRLAGLIWFDYGQPAALMEWRALVALRHHLGINATVPVNEIPLTVLAAGAMKATAGEAGPRVVPHRNLVMLALALNWAETLDAKEIWYGAVQDDCRDYADCRGTFIKSLNEALDAPMAGGLRASHPFVGAPLIGTPKPKVVEEARAYGILDLCWSCYTPRDNRPCGTCNSCVSRGGS